MGFVSTKDKIESVLWGTPPSDPAERKLRRKLDGVILSYVCLSYFVNYLDRSNLANAYVSGMEEDIGFVGNDYTFAGTMFTAGYLVGQWPSGLVLSSGKVPVRYWFTFCCLIWAIVTLCFAFVKTPHQVWALRFLQGCFEATSFSGTHYILGAWYKDGDLGRRAAVFTCAAQMGTLFSGFLQGGIIASLENRGALKGWQWLFIVDFLITLPVAAWGFIMFPDLPHNTTAFWLTEEDKHLCKRMTPPQAHTGLTRDVLNKIVRSWQFWLFPILFGVGWPAFEKTGVYSEFSLWLKWTGIIGTYSAAVFADLTGRFFTVNLIMYGSCIVSCSMLLYWNISDNAHMFAYIINGLGYAGQATNLTWANTLCRDDETVRAFILFTMNIIGQCWSLWYAIVAWPVVDQPEFRNGQIATLVTGAFVCGVGGAIVYCSKRWPPTTVDPGSKIEAELGRTRTRTLAHNILDVEAAAGACGGSETPVDEKDVTSVNVDAVPSDPAQN